jgi:hypothetical protein
MRSELSTASLRPDLPPFPELLNSQLSRPVAKRQIMSGEHSWPASARERGEEDEMTALFSDFL